MSLEATRDPPSPSLEPQPSGAQPALLPRGGLLYLTRPRGREGGEVVFIASAVAREVTDLTAVTPIIGAAPPVVGIALAHGEVVTVLELGLDDADPGASSPPQGAPPKRRSWRAGQDWPTPGARRAVVCEVDGDAVAIIGGEVIATGLFDAAPQGGGVLWRGAVAPPLDLDALVARCRRAIWDARSAGAGP